MKYIDKELCVGCGLCVPHCTDDAIVIDGDKAIFATECIDCPFCSPEEICPVGAIKYE